MTEDTTKFGLSRRTLAKGAAWSVPAVAVAAGAPAFAVSGVGQVACGCKDPGNPWQYRMRFCFKNTMNTSVTLTITSFMVDGNVLINLNAEGWTNNTVTIAAGATACSVIAGNNTRSGNGMGRVDFSYTIGASTAPVYTGYVQGATNDLPPCHDGLRLTLSCGDFVIVPPTTGDTGNRTTSAEAKVEEPKVEEKPVVEEPKEEIQPVIEAEVTEDSAVKTEAAPAEAADAEADA